MDLERAERDIALELGEHVCEQREIRLDRVDAQRRAFLGGGGEEHDHRELDVVSWGPHFRTLCRKSISS